MKAETMNYHEAMEQVSQRFDDLIADCILHTTMTYEKIAAEFGLETKYIQRVAKARGINRPKGSGSPAHPKNAKRDTDERERRF
jgi:hypothetical protein